MGRFRRSVFLVVTAVLAAALGTTGPAFAAPPGTRIALTVLVVTDGGPSATAIAAELKSQGVPHRVLDLRDDDRPVIDAAFLADTVTENGVVIDRAHYQAVVMPGPQPFADPAEFAALVAYQQRFDIPQVNAYVWPEGAVGLQPPTYSGPLDGVTAALTPAGLAAFDYLTGAVPFDDNAPAVSETWGFLARPLPDDPATGATTIPLLTAAAPNGTGGNTLVAEYRAGNRRQLSMTFSYNNAQTQWRLLAPGVVTWMTGGVHLGLGRNFFSVQIDDVLLQDARWDVDGNCTPGDSDACPEDESTTIRMTPADATAAADWQTSRDFPLDMVYNAYGSDTYAEGHDGQDPLADRLVSLKSQFRWTNHTYSHKYLGCLRDVTVVPWRCEKDPDTGEVRWNSATTLRDEIEDNLDWATAKGIPDDPEELVTGEHSGLKILPQQPQHNPNLGPVLDDTGVKWIAADNSRMSQQVRIGSALTVPRYPLNVYYNVAKRTEQVDEYNWIYTSRADGGSGICEDNPGTVTCISPLGSDGFEDYIIPLETRFALGRILANDPRPHFVHQGNIAEDRILYPLLDSILGRYRSLLSADTPIVNPRLSEAGATMRRQAVWADAVRDGDVSGYLQDGRVHITAPASVEVPLTVPATTAFGDAYAGSRSAWAEPGTDGTVDVTLA